MYEEYWKLNCLPFSNTPDPSFFYRSRQHDEALTKLSYAVNENMGAAMLTGPYGCGKTLLARLLFHQIAPAKRSAICSAQPDMTPLDLLRLIARRVTDLRLPATHSELVPDALLEIIESALTENARDGKHTVILIDEAHMINAPQTWETMRLLLNFQDEQAFLLTLLLFGHPELGTRVSEIRQLAQRVPVRCSLDHFTHEDTMGYVEKRMAVAGSEKKLFGSDALSLIHRNSGGIPRRINTLCDVSLAMGFARRAETIDANLVADAAEKFGVA